MSVRMKLTFASPEPKDENKKFHTYTHIYLYISVTHDSHFFFNIFTTTHHL